MPEQTSDSFQEPDFIPAPTAKLERRLEMNQPPKLLIVEDDEDLATLLSDHLAETLRADVLAVGTVHHAAELELDRPSDVILADLLLPDGDAIGLMRQLDGISEASFVLMSGVPTIGRIVEGMRLGAVDFLPKPFELSQLTSSVSDALAKHQDQARLRVRYERMRRLSKQIIADRRELRERVDLVCRDLVHAYRRLANRVVELYEMYGYQPDP